MILFKQNGPATKLLVTTIVIVTSAGGCQSFSGGSDVVADYERMRNQLSSGYPSSEVQQASYSESQRTTTLDPIDDSGLSVESLSPSNLGKTYRHMIGKGPNEEKAREAFAKAEKLYREAVNTKSLERRRNFLEAAPYYVEAANRWPDSALHEDGLFKEGECKFFADQYRAAENAYGRLIKHYPNTKHLDIVGTRRFAIAKYWLSHHKKSQKTSFLPNLTDASIPRMGTFSAAMRIFDRIRIDDPTGQLADDATMSAAIAYFEAKDYSRADGLFTDLRDAFPSSEHQFEAHLLALKTKAMAYQGPDYNDLPLEESEKLIKSIRRQFRDELRDPKKQEMVNRAHAEVIAKRENRDWHFAQYHERRKEYRGARHYYREILKRNLETEISNAARQRLAALDNQPDRPTQRVAWLPDVFGDFDGTPTLNAESQPTQLR